MIARATLLSLILLLSLAVSPGIIRAGSDELPKTPIPILSSDFVYPGMKGDGKTTFMGGKIEEFQVEVIAIYGRRSLWFNKYSYIMAKISGPNIDIAGGFNEGMSGSPVFIGGKLVGAISSSHPWSDHRYVLITTIDAMMDIFSFEEDTGHESSMTPPLVLPEADPSFDRKTDLSPTSPPLLTLNSQPVLPWTSLNPGTAAEVISLERELYIDGRRINKVIVDDDTKLWESLTGREKIETLPFVRMRGKPFVRLSPKLSLQELEAGPGGSLSTTPLFSKEYFQPPSDFVPPKLEPGAPISVALVKGDVQIGLGGTLTYVGMDGRILAFGHPVLEGLGDVILPLGRGYVYATQNEIEERIRHDGFLDIVGRITQDRPIGVSGSLGDFDDFVPVSIEATNADTGRSISINFDVLRDARYFYQYFAQALSMALEKTLDYWGEGTIYLSFDIDFTTTQGFETFEPGKVEKITDYLTLIDGHLRGEDVYYSTQDFRAPIAARLGMAANLLSRNDLQAVTPKAVTIKLFFTKERHTSHFRPENLTLERRSSKGDESDFVKTEPERGIYKFEPGESLHIKGELNSYRGGTWPFELTLDIPKEFAEGKGVLQVYGTGGIPFPQDVGRDAFTRMQGAYNRRAVYDKSEAPSNLRELLSRTFPKFSNSYVVLELILTDPKDKDKYFFDKPSLRAAVSPIDDLVLGFESLRVEVTSAEKPAEGKKRGKRR